VFAEKKKRALQLRASKANAAEKRSQGVRRSPKQKEKTRAKRSIMGVRSICAANNLTE